MSDISELVALAAGLVFGAVLMRFTMWIAREIRSWQENERRWSGKP